jgi:GMP synthase (glutamine-hydrolysing)
VKRVLLLKPGVTSSRASLGDYEVWFAARCGAQLVPVELHAGERAPSLGGFDAVIMSGSPLSVTALYEPTLDAQLAFAPAAADYLLEAAQRVPVLGVCFGHQLLAWRLGAPVRRNPRGRELGTVQVTVTPEGQGDALYRALPPTLSVQAVHEDEVAQLPAGATLHATNARSQVQAFGVGPRLRAVQFHPEMDAASTQFCVDADATGQAAPVFDSPHGAQLLRNFLRLA